ncbi:hypothetical protein pEaSNUABM54_00289 [Erwinia phage pEa_SNUABM_54]|nr:hypothetical protein pEaSNUABM54_00289 [Erwinia phage pEa_SNUABM_54]
MQILLSERADTGQVRNSAAIIDIACNSLVYKIPNQSHRWLSFEQVQALHEIDKKIDDRLKKRLCIEVPTIGEPDNRKDIARFITAVCKQEVNKYTVDGYYRRQQQGK